MTLHLLRSPLHLACLAALVPTLSGGAAAACPVPGAVHGAVPPVVAGAVWRPEQGSKVLREPLPNVVPPPQGTLLVSGSMRIAAGEYPRRVHGDDGVLLVQGQKDVVIDLEGATFLGSPTPLELETCASRGIVVRDCENVTLRGGVLRGYHTAVWVERTRGLVIEGMTIEGTFARRLRSTIAVESEEDWIRWPADDDSEFGPHLGAAVRLAQCSDVTVRNCGARHGQNGLLVADCRGVQIYRNDFSFLSGWGLAGLHVEDLVASHNRFDYCLRGYSQGFYASAQNSAAFVLLGESRNNVFAKNSALRAGKGVVLRYLGSHGAGAEEPMSTLIWGNDFSGAVAGGAEIEGSADVWVVGNLFENCAPYGILARNARRVLVGDNTFKGIPGSAVAFEDPSECVVARNVLTRSEVGLEVWTADGEGARQSRARDLWVVRNSFSENDADLGVRDVRGLRINDNIFQEGEYALVVSDLVPAPGVPPLVLEGRDPETGERVVSKVEPRSWLRGLGDRMPSGHLWRSTIWHPDAEPHPLIQAFDAFGGPEVPGWPLGRLPRSLAEGDLAVGEWGPWDFEGGSERPTLRRPGGVLVDSEWSTAWFPWRPDSDPRGNLELWRAGALEPLTSDVVRAWATPWGEDDQRARTIGRERFGLVATTRASLPEGSYRLTIVSDDGVRFLVDGRSVLENWSWHPAVRDTVEFELEAGDHEFCIEYFQIDGAAALLVDLDRLAAGRAVGRR